MKISNFQRAAGGWRPISRNGFTLMEFLVIIGIIGILALIGIPTFRSYQPTLQLSGSVRNLVSDLRYAQQLAVTEQIEYGVRFSTTTDPKYYQIIKYGGTTSTVKTVEFPEEIIRVSISDLSDINSDKEARYIPYGSVREEGEITLENSKNATTTIEVRPSGFVKIID